MSWSLIFGLLLAGEGFCVPPRDPIPHARHQEKLGKSEGRDQGDGGFHFPAFFLRWAASVRALAAAFEALVANFRRSSAVIDFVRAIPPSRAISRTSMRVIITT